MKRGARLLRICAAAFSSSNPLQATTHEPCFHSLTNKCSEHSYVFGVHIFVFQLVRLKKAVFIQINVDCPMKIALVSSSFSYCFACIQMQWASTCWAEAASRYASED